MHIEIYDMQVENDKLRITLEAICDTFSSLIWDVRYYECGQFEVYIAATERNVDLFRKGKIIGRSDDKEYFGIIEKVHLDTDTENGDYLTVSGRFLMSIFSRRIIYPTLSFTLQTAYSEILRTAVKNNCIAPADEIRIIPGLQLGTVSGDCWEQTASLQISYKNLMDWVYTICKVTGGTANLRLQETAADSGLYTLQFELTEGVDRSTQQTENAHVIFSDGYNNLLSYSHETDDTSFSNVAYVFGEGEGSARNHAMHPGSAAYQATGLERYEIYVDARDITRTITNENGETEIIGYTPYLRLLMARGAEKKQPVVVAEEFEIVADNGQFQYVKDYFVGDYVTVQHGRFGMLRPKIQLTGMIESFDQNGRSLVPTFEEREGSA